MKVRIIIVALLIGCCAFAPSSFAQTAKTDRDSSKVEVIEIDVGGVKVKVPNLVLRDQDDRPVRFYSDLIKDKVIVLSFFYTSCTYTCTMQGRVFSELQSLLGERLGKSVFLISVTSDPLKDNPPRLKAWGERYKRKSGWTLITGEAAEMNGLLLEFTGSRTGGSMHLPSTFIANDKTGVWTSVVGVFGAEELLKVIDQIGK